MSTRIRLIDWTSAILLFMVIAAAGAALMFGMLAYISRENGGGVCPTQERGGGVSTQTGVPAQKGGVCMGGYAMRGGACRADR